MLSADFGRFHVRGILVVVQHSGYGVAGDSGQGAVNRLYNIRADSARSQSEISNI